jgi:hypothetical protein
VASVTYGADANASTFSAAGCALTVPHTQIVCTTAPGAGAGLKWLVDIDGQRSVAPTTAYAPPAVAAFAAPGLGSTDAFSTEGGEAVLVSGADFAQAAWLQAVSYGPTGREFVVTRNCTVSAPNAQLACLTAPGAGRRLPWLVTVGGQTSALSGATISYAPPAVSAVARADGAQPPTLTTGGSPADGVMIVVNGTNFGLLPGGGAAAQLRVFFNERGAAGNPPPPDAQLNAYYDALLNGAAADGAANAAMAGWLASLAQPAFVVNWAAPRAHQVRVAVPPGYGTGAAVLVQVGGVLSATPCATCVYAGYAPPPTFAYAPPALSAAAPDQQFVPAGNLRLVLAGASLCAPAAFPGCGTLFIVTPAGGGGAGVAVPPAAILNWTSTAVVANLAGYSGTRGAYVVVGGQASNVVTFDKPVPFVNPKENGWIRNVKLDTAGGAVITVDGVQGVSPGQTVTMTIGGNACGSVVGPTVCAACTPPAGVTEYTLKCTAPPGTGKDSALLITADGETSAVASALRVSYEPPHINATLGGGVISTQNFASAAAANSARAAGAAPTSAGRRRRALLAAAAGGVSTLGGVVSIRGRYFGSLAAGGAVAVSTCFGPATLLKNRTDAALSFFLPAGQGKGCAIVLAVGGCAAPACGAAQSPAETWTFDYLPPAVASVASAGPACRQRNSAVHSSAALLT